MRRFNITVSDGFLKFTVVATAVSVCAFIWAVKRPKPQTQPAILSSGTLSEKVSDSGFSDLNKISITPNVRKPLDLERIFSESRIPENDPETVLLIATGDVMTGRSVNAESQKRNDFLWAFREVSATVSAADITLINLENPLLAGCPTTVSGMVFCGDIRHIDGLRSIGTDIVSFANNHANNHGVEGIRETESILSDAGMLVAGLQVPVFLEKEGIVFSFLAYNDVGSQEEGISWAEGFRIKDDIEKADSNSDVVIVSFHWGNEYVRMPTDNQKRLARLAVDAGADLIIGNHPHWYQPVEIYHGRVVVYSHGNFVFDQMWSKETMTGIVGSYGFSGGKLVSVRFLPVGIRDFGQAYFLTGGERDAVLTEMEKASGDLIRTTDDE